MKLINLLFIMTGIIFTGIGLIGVLVPVLPTTPFLLLASACFVKGSDRFDHWFKNTKLYKDYAEDYINDRSMTFGRKAKLMLLSDFMLAIPLIKLDNLYLRLFILLVIVFKYWYFIFKIKTKKE
ncbi:MAG: YbaN family protein [Tissierellales bacterium]